MAIIPLPFDIPLLYDLALLFLLLIIGIVIIILIAKVLLFILPAGIIRLSCLVPDGKLVLGRRGFSSSSVYLIAEKITKSASLCTNVIIGNMVSFIYQFR